MRGRTVSVVTRRRRWAIIRKQSSISRSGKMLCWKISGGKITVEVAESMAMLGDAYENQGMYPESMECLEKALEVQLKELGEEHATVADTYEKLGWTCSWDGKYDKAMEYHEKGLSIRLKVHGGEDHVDVGHSHHMLGCVYWRKGKYEEALKHYEIALRIRSEKLGADHKDVAETYNTWLMYTTIKASTRKRWQCTRSLCRSD